MAAPNTPSQKAAFEIDKGSQPLLSLSEAQVVQYLDPEELLRTLEASFGALARGEVQCPPRPQITVPDKGFSLAMSAWQRGMQICVKVVNVFEGNLEIGLLTRVHGQRQFERQRHRKSDEAVQLDQVESELLRTGPRVDEADHHISAGAR